MSENQSTVMVLVSNSLKIQYRYSQRSSGVSSLLKRAEPGREMPDISSSIAINEAVGSFSRNSLEI
jgi:hypothetical protein